MKKIILGRSGLETGCIGAECGSLLSVSFEESRCRLQRALSCGITFFDIGMPEEELQKRIGHGLVGQRSQVLLAGSFVPDTPQKFQKQLEQVLRGLKTDYLDLCQIHDPDYMPRRGDAEGVYDAMLQAREKGGHDFTFLYLGEVDDIGHRYGWMGKEYLQAVSHSFDCIARVYEAMDPEDLLIVTADHGGHQRSHGTDCPEDMTIPVLAVGSPFAPGSTLPETRIIDLAPTIAKFLGVPADADWEGHSLY